MTRRAPVLVALLLAWVNAHGAAQQAYPWQGMGVAVARPAARAAIAARAVDGVALTVSDADRSIRFYRDVLTFRVISDRIVEGAGWEALTGIPAARTRLVDLALGDEHLQLMQFLAPHGRAAPTNMQSNDRWFQHVAIIVRDMDSAYARLAAAGVVHVSPSPQTLPATIPPAAGIRAFYFRDPDGHPLEILAFPPDKGAAKWHAPSSALFLGIDHTAIVVWNTERSRAFYGALLGLEVKGESMNFGREQERLNNVAGARLHITGLRAGAGPGVEFLDYRAPRTGRPYPADERPSDIAHWQTRIVVDDVDEALQVVRAQGVRVISREPATLDPAATGFRRAVLVRDPDGHAVELVAR
jgi:catechol 2,3-dioxygenase-like lactoylglutathione lyase family enzyme